MKPDDLLETLPGGTRLFSWQGQKITTDSLLLAAFCQFKPQWSVCDLGCGSGLLMLSLIDRGLYGTAVGVEQNDEAAALLEKAIALNHLENATVYHGDLTLYRSRSLFDMVVANPPYFTQGEKAQGEARAGARHQLNCNIGQVCAAARRLLKDRGRFCLCWPADGLATLFNSLAASKLKPKRLQLVRKGHQSNARLALVDARKAAGEGMLILPDITIPSGDSLAY